MRMKSMRIKAERKGVKKGTPFHILRRKSNKTKADPSPLGAITPIVSSHGGNGSRPVCFAYANWNGVGRRRDENGLCIDGR